ncbi:MAG: hypothetical protein LBM92_07120 [Opitutaceae bacterium]|jgi:hypothetical protein|nr:hypothetical protein [Opitutaceae bacterium]
MKTQHIIASIAALFSLAAMRAETPGAQDWRKAFLEMQNSRVMMDYVHPYRLMQGRESDIRPSGAIAANAQWERKERPNRYIDEQRRGADFFAEPALATNNPAALQQGLAIMQHGLDWQAGDGTFPGCPDEFHSAIFFLESISRALVLMRASDNECYQRQLAKWKPKLEILARRLMKPEVADARRNLADAEKFTHRDYIYAAAYAMVSGLAALPGAQEAAARHAERSLARQHPDGTNPERGGFDMGYQAAGLLFAGRYFYFCDDDAMRRRIAAMYDKALAAMRDHLDSDGNVKPEGNTRIGKEKDREGVKKKVNHAVIVNVFATGAHITGRQDYADFAKIVGEKQVAPLLKASAN